MPENTFLNFCISGIISFLVAIVSINNNIVDAQWVETPPRYFCPTGKLINWCLITNDVKIPIYVINFLYLPISIFLH